MKHLSKLRRTAAEILAAAVYETFPGVELLGGFETLSGFSYDFYFPHLIHPELHFQIEERMRQIVREKREIRDFEMVSVSAKEYLKSKGHQIRASQVGDRGLFSLVEVGSFVDLSAGEHLKNTAEVGAFKISPPTILEDRKIRVSGVADVSKDALKNFLKKLTAYAKNRHEVVGEIQHFWKILNGSFIWLPDGLAFRKKVLDSFREHLFHNALEISGPRVDGIHAAMLQDTKSELIAEIYSFTQKEARVEEVGLFDPQEGTILEISTSLKNGFSFLQSIGKTLIILGFHYRLRLNGGARKEREQRAFLVRALETLGWSYDDSDIAVEEKAAPCIEFLVKDGLEREWSAATVFAKECLSVRVFVERNTALLLELSTR